MGGKFLRVHVNGATQQQRSTRIGPAKLHYLPIKKALQEKIAGVMGVVTWTQVLAAIGVSMGSLVVGFSNGYTSTALISMTDRDKTPFEVTSESASWIGGIMPLTALAGGISGGPLIELLGRRNTLLAIAVPFSGAYLLIALAVNVKMVLIGRAFGGYCVGISSLAFPIYLAETLHPEVRGTLGLFPTLFGNGGLLLAYAAGAFLEWSELAFLGATLPVPFLILMIIATETPRWYVSHEKEEKARTALEWLRGKEVDVGPELKELHAMKTEAAADEEPDTLCRRVYLKPLMIALGLMFFQQLSGINAVIFYTVSIFRDAGSSIDSFLCTVIVGFVNLLATLAATLLVDRLGRKVLLYISDAAMILTLFVLGVFFYCKHLDMDMSAVGWVPLLSFVVYVIGFSMGFGPIPWLMMGEILPVKVRGPAASLVTGFNWFGAFVVTKTFQNIIDLIGSHGAFWLFCAICVLGLFFVVFFVPETRHISLEDIERRMTGRSEDKKK